MIQMGSGIRLALLARAECVLALLARVQLPFLPFFTCKACPSCKGRMRSYCDKFWCDKCPEHSSVPLLWYRVHLVVSDSTGFTNFVMFGKVVEDLTEVPANVLAKSSKPSKENILAMILKLIDRIMIFLVTLNSRHYNPNNVSFKVVRVSEIPWLPLAPLLMVLLMMVKKGVLVYWLIVMIVLVL